MLTHKTDISTRSTRSTHSLGLLVLTVLFAAIIGGLPFGHQLFHESLVEPEHCPVCLLQSSVSLLFLGLPLVLVASNAAALGPATPRTVPLPLFNPRFTHFNRGPPRC